MTDDTIDLTRRKVLASAGTVGLVGAGAAMGTNAFLNDHESFEDNTLTAGALDLTVVWEEHYWNDFAVDGVSVEQVGGVDDVGDDQVGLPDPTDPLVAVDDLEAFMDATAIEAFPDTDDDGSQDALDSLEPCEDFAQLDDGLDPSGDRTDSDDTRLDDESPAPLVALDDVKPGDFGELTLGFHLCDNPGYVWLHGGPAEASENGHTEPESVHEDETGASDEVATGEAVLDSDVELLDAVRTKAWYDDGDNVLESSVESEPVDLVVVFDQSESMNAGGTSGSNDLGPGKLDAAVSGASSLVDTVGATTNLGLVYFSDTDATQVIQELGSSRGDIEQDLADLDGPDDPTNPLVDDNQSGVDSSGSGTQVDSDGDGNDDDNLILDTDLEGGIRVANDELTGPRARSGARKVMVVLSDGKPWPGGQDVTGAADDAKADGIEIFSIAYGSGADESLMATIASDPEASHAFAGGEADVEEIFGEIGTIIGGEEAFFSGSLRELLAALESGAGIPLDGSLDTRFDEIGDPAGDDAREAFEQETTHFVGLSWWLPRAVDNEVQTDSVAFDVGFYAEQERHNDGSGATSSTADSTATAESTAPSTDS